LKNRDVVAGISNIQIGDSLPYSLVAHAYSNLQFDATLQQDSLKPGTMVTLQATLKQYDVPFTGDAAVWAEITNPDLSSMNLKLNRVADGVYSGTFTASAVGVYPSRIRAEGYFQNKDKFTREKTLTAATYLGNYDTTPRGDDTLCGLLHCLTSGKVITQQAMERLRALGIDWEQFQKCIDKVCPEVPDHLPTEPKKPRPAMLKPKVNIKAERAARQIKLPKAEQPKKKAMAGMGPVTFPRVIRMFQKPDEMKEPMAEDMSMKAKMKKGKRKK
jgi:hypothetical protein